MSLIETFKVETVDVSIPVVTTNTPGYKSRNVANYTYRMKHYHIDVLHRIKQGLVLRGAHLADKRPVDSIPATLCWVLEQIDAKAPVSPAQAVIDPTPPGAPSVEKISRGEKIENENSKNENSKISDLEI